MKHICNRSALSLLALGLVLTLVMALAACAGTAGSTGPTGAAGPAGKAGADGKVGADGKAGPAGPAGPAGKDGAPAVPPKPKTVVVDAGKDQTASPGATVTLKATADAQDGSKVNTYQWTQVSGTPAKLAGADTATATVTLPDLAAFKVQLLKGMELLDRVTVQAVIPHALAVAETAAFKVTVTTSSGSFSKTVNVVTDIPWADNGGISDVAINVPVLMNAKKQPTYAWTLTSPSGSKAELDSSSDRNPSFTPDVSGKYTVTETYTNKSVDVYAGTWAGNVTGQDAKGRPVSAGCTSCHNGKIASDKFTPWAQSGHAEIFTQNINDPAGHWAINCAQCHTVGYNPGAKNGGFDEAVAAEGWKVPPHGDKGLWDSILANFPKTASLANIQCENCHGPNNTALHANGVLDKARISLSSDVCGQCHGEPLRHGRYQQWELSRHANFEILPSVTVENRGASAAHCGRCHTAQGFLAWIKQPDMTKYIQGAKGDATVEELRALGLTQDQAQPQTCTVCHDPHDEGTTTSKENNAKVRISGNTSMLPSGFQAIGVGRGAICITCHNTRNGLHNDKVGNPPSYSAPHVASQGDILMGENAYFVAAGQRSKHALIEDTCAKCHMEATPPPAEFSYQLGGTNHAFKATMKACGDCHGKFTGEGVQHLTEAKLEELGQKMASYLLSKMPSTIMLKDYTPHTYQGKSFDLLSNVVEVNKANIASIEPTEPHGQQGFLVKFKTPVSVTYAPANQAPHTLTVSEVEVQLGSITTDGTKALIATSDPLVRAGWNYFLVHGDGSKGVHNPTFAVNVLQASIDALK